MDNAAKELGRKIISELEKIVHALTRTPRQQDEAGITPQHQSQSENDATQGQSALQSHIPAAQKNPEKPENPWHKTLVGWKTVFELVAIPFAILYAVVTFYEWRDLRHNFEVDQRALVKIGFNFPTLGQISTFGALLVTAINTGKSPALHVRITANLEIVDYSNPPTLGSSNKPVIIDVGMLFPNDPMKPQVVSTTSRLENGHPVPFNPSQTEDLLAGKTYIAAYGIAEYSDQFGRHWTRFCDWKSYTERGTGANADPCVQWSAIGDGPAPK